MPTLTDEKRVLEKGCLQLLLLSKLITFFNPLAFLLWEMHWPFKRFAMRLLQLGHHGRQARTLQVGLHIVVGREEAIYYRNSGLEPQTLLFTAHRSLSRTVREPDTHTHTHTHTHREKERESEREKARERERERNRFYNAVLQKGGQNRPFLRTS